MKNVVTVCLLLLMLASSAHSDLIVNGDFESGPNYPGLIYQAHEGSTEITGWVVTRNTVEYCNLDEAFADGRYIDLDASPGAGGLAQTFQTSPGQVYEVSFELYGISHPSGPDMKHLGITVAGHPFEYFFDTTINHNLLWDKHSFVFTATDITSTLEFYSLDPETSYCGPLIDNVTVEAVPEPATLLLIGIGGLILRKR